MDAEIHVRTEAIETFYDIGDQIGSGQFAVVKKLHCQTSGKTYAAKFMKKKRSKASKKGMSQEQFLREADVLRSIEHKGVIYLHEIFETKLEYVLVLELLTGGELFEFLSEQEFLTEEEAVGFLKQVIEAIEYLHGKRIVHLDIKPENIVLKEEKSSQIKLIDFGLARKLTHGEMVREIMGTPEFVAPEIIAFEDIGTETDMWAIGVLTYIMLSGASPFLGDDVNETFSNISMVDYEFDDEYFKDISLPAKNFISNLLVKDTRDRMNAAECLKHEWMQDLDDQESANSSEDDDICDALIPSPSKRKNEILKRRSTLIKTDAFKAFTARARWQKSLNKVIAISRLALLGKKNGPIQRSIACRDTTTADTTLNKTNNDQDINNRNNIQECTVPEEKVKREFENNTEIYTIPEESTTKEEFQNQSREEKVVSDNVVNENVFKKENVATNDHVEENTIYQEDSHTARSDAFEENQIHLLSDDSSKSRINAKTVNEIKDPNCNIEVKRESRSNNNLEDTSLSSISSKGVEREVKQDDNGFRQDGYDSNNAFKMKLDSEKLKKEDEVHLVQKGNYKDIDERDTLHSEESGIKSSKDINGQVTQENMGYVSNQDTSEITQKEKIDQGNGAFENDLEVVSHMARLNQVEHKNTPVTISGKIPERDTDKSEYLPLEQDRQVKPHRSVKDEHAEETKSKTSKQDGTPDEKRFYKIRTFENSSSNRKTTKSRDRAIGFEDLKYMFSNPNESDQSSGGFGAHESKSRARRVGGGNLKLVAKMYELDLQANGEERTSKTSGAREESGASRIRKAKPITQTETNVEEPVHSSNSKLNEFGNFSTKRKTSNEFAKLKQNFETEGVSSKDKLGHKHVDSKADYLNKSRKKDRVANGHKTENATKSEDEFKVDRQNDKPLSDLHVLDPAQPTKGGSTRVEKMEDNNDTLAEKADDENGSSSKEQSQATRTSKALEERKRKESTDSDQSLASDSSFPTRSKRFDDSSWLTNRKPFKINKDKTDHMTSRKRKTSARAEILKWEQKSSGEAVPTKSSFSSQSLLKREQEQRRSMPKIATVTKTDLKENRYPFERHSFGGLREGGEERRNLLSRKGHTNRNQTSKEEKDTTSSTRQQMSGEFLNERKMSSKDTTSDIEIKVTTSTKSGAHAMNISKEVPNYNQYTAGDVHITTTVNKTDVGDYIEKAGETSSETEASVENTADSFAECSSSVTNVTTDEPIGESFTNDTESKIDESENAKEFAMENKSVPENTRKRSTLTRLHSAEGSPNSLGIAAIDKEHVFVIRTSLNSQDSGLDSESEVASVDSLEELDVPETSNATQNVMITQHEVLPKQTDQFPEMALTLQKSPTSPDITDKNAFVWVVTTEKNKRGDFLSKDLAPNVESSKGSSNQADIYEKRRIRHKPMGAKGPPKLRAMSTPLEPVTKKSEVHVRRGRVTSDSSIEKQNVPTVRLTSDMPAFTFKIQQGEIELAD